ncbi:MAG TPA: response regulator [Vicinamibacterales bacterium]|nr:response regulator [Vicinamibacterales bacterium]
MKSLAIRAVFAATLSALMLSATGWFSLSRLRALADANKHINHAYEVLAAIEDVRAQVADVESSQHAVLMNHTDGTATSYVRNLSELNEALDRLDAVILNSDQRERLGGLRRLLTHQRTLFDQEIEAGRDSGHDDHDAIAEAIDGIRGAEEGLLASGRIADAASESRALSSVWIAIVLTGMFMIGAGLQIATGIRRSQRAEAALRVSDARNRAMFNAMITGMVLTDEKGNIVANNPAVEQMLGVEPGRLVGQSVGEFVVLPSGPEARTLTEEGDRIAGQITQQEIRRADGRIVPVECSLVKFDTGDATFFAANWRDTSERREIDRMKNEFISVVSHELRTPLTSVRGALQLVLADPPQFQDPDHQPLLGIALKNCERLIRIINDILDVSKIEAGKLELKVKACDVGELARASAGNVADVAREAGVALAIDLEKGLPNIRGDFDRLVQVLVNLLSNAVKFSPSGATVSLQARSNGDRVSIAIADAGPGIADADLGKLFVKFGQIDASAKRKAGGTGLGLSIVKALVDQHGGTVSVSSLVGTGTTFTVALPAVDEPAMPAVVAAASPRRQTILVVDDDADIRLVLRRQLEAVGYRVCEAVNGDGAIAAAVDLHPDLITMDLVMPGMGGLSAIRRLAADPRTRAIPIVIVSAVADDVSFDHEFAIVAKPIDADRLQREIAVLIGKPSNATLLLAEDDEDLRRVLSQSLARGGFRVMTAGDGAAAQRIFDETPCDAVVVDLHMPDVDGFAVIEHVRRSPTRANTPILVVSGSNTGDGRTRAMQLGANVYFSKPVDASALVREIDQMVA